MSAKEMFDYFTGTLAADYTTTDLTVKPQRVLVERLSMKQKTFESDDGSVVVSNRSSRPIFTVTLQWTLGISEADAGTIYDFWADSSKGNGMERTFYWDHPTDGHDYTVRFFSDLSRTLTAGYDIHKISQIKLRVEGVKP